MDIKNLEYNISRLNINNDNKKTKKQIQIDLVFKPKDGVSEWVSRDTICANKILNWGANGLSRHNIYFNDKRYIWEKFPVSGKIEKLRLNGFSEEYLKNLPRPIRKDIDKFYKKSKCVVCGSKSSLVTDHKNDLYNDIRVLNSKTQVLDDFQCLCTHCNLQKRQISKECVKTGKRYGATNIPSLKYFGIDFILGDEKYDPDDIKAMIGTYWYDPVEFVKKLHEVVK